MTENTTKIAGKRRTLTGNTDTPPQIQSCAYKTRLNVLYLPSSLVICLRWTTLDRRKSYRFLRANFGAPLLDIQVHKTNYTHKHTRQKHNRGTCTTQVALPLLKKDLDWWQRRSNRYIRYPCRKHFQKEWGPEPPRFVSNELRQHRHSETSITPHVDMPTI